jgi:hypothetical protein
VSGFTPESALEPVRLGTDFHFTTAAMSEALYPLTVLKGPNIKAQGFNAERYTQIGAEDPKYPTHNFQINLKLKRSNSKLRVLGP